MLPTMLGGMHFSLGYIIINLNPVFLQIGNLAIHWYGLAYVVAICVGLWFLLRWTHTEGISDDQTWGLFLWGAIAGLVGGRLYFVIQQPDLLTNYIEQPLHIISVWDGGMAFFGAIFLGGATLFALAPRYGLHRFLVLDGAAFFAAIGQIFGRFGNIINGDITGQALSATPITIPGATCAQAPCLAYVANAHFAPWAFVYLNPHSFAPQGIPFQPAPVFEMITNLIALAILWNLRFSLPRKLPGLFFNLYVAFYAIGQFLVFFFRGSEPYTPFLGIDFLKQAQWTALFTLLMCVPLYLIVRRFSSRWPYSAKNPVPWGTRAPAVAIGPQTATAASAPRAPMTVTARVMAPKQVTNAPVATETLPPWTPTHATHGQLRNVLGASHSPKVGHLG